MTATTITVTVSEDVYALLDAQARNRARFMDDVVAQTLRSALPPPEPDLPLALQAELNAMEPLSDEALGAIAPNRANNDKIALYDLLITRQNVGSLTTDGRKVPTQLREEADALMVRKAQAYAILHSRGYKSPTLDSRRKLRRGRRTEDTR